MRLARSVAAALLGLFVDDGSLALQVLLLVLAVAALIGRAGLAPLAGACAILAGCLAILGLSLRRAARDGWR